MSSNDIERFIQVLNNISNMVVAYNLSVLMVRNTVRFIRKIRELREQARKRSTGSP